MTPSGVNDSPLVGRGRQFRRRRRDVGPHLALLSPPGASHVGRMVGGCGAPSAWEYAAFKF